MSSSGWSPAEIAERLGSAAAPCGMAAAARIRCDPNPNAEDAVSPQPPRSCAALRRDGLTIAQLAARYG